MTTPDFHTQALADCLTTIGQALTAYGRVLAVGPAAPPEAGDLDDGDVDLSPGMTPVQARSVFDQVVTACDGQAFAPHDLREVLERTGYGRAWLHKVLRERVETGALEHDPETGTYRQASSVAKPAPGAEATATALVKALTEAGVDLAALLRALRDQS
jgi:hypothetical protein